MATVENKPQRNHCTIDSVLHIHDIWVQADDDVGIRS